MEIDQEKLYRAAFRSIKGVGNRHLRQIIAYFGSAATAWNAPRQDLSQMAPQQKWLEEVVKERELLDPGRIGESLKVQGIKLLTPLEEGYPALLRELADAPPLLYYRGTLKIGSEVLAIVGSRQATAYGKSAARMLAREAAGAGLVVASGLARGIDTAAHQGALEGEGVTWAFLGCGLDQVYPKENTRLAVEILDRGAVISEFSPGTPPLAANFPARNRLISGCSRGVVVVEAAEKSGALITVDFALEQGREVFAVPGPIFSPVSRGSHHLLRQGAKISEGIWDILAEFPEAVKDNLPGNDINKRLSTKTGSELNSSETGSGLESENSDYDKILQLLSDLPVHIDQLAVHSSLSAASLSLALLELQLAGRIKQLPGQNYVLSRETLDSSGKRR